MSVKKEVYSFKKLQFSKLFKTYVSDFSKLKDFYCYDPFSERDIQQKADSFFSEPLRNKYVEALSLYHKELGINQSEQLKKLGTSGALAIVTGQQLGIYGGPLFTVYKTLTTILLAKEWTVKLNRPVIPVFWLADEDHDFDEVSWFGIPGNEDLEKIKYESDLTNFPVSEYILDGSLESFKKDLLEKIHETDFSSELWAVFDSNFAKGQTFAAAFAQMIDSLFGKYGVLVAGSNFKPIKELVAGAFKTSIIEAVSSHEALAEKTAQIDKNFHDQVTLGDSNLFYMCGKQGRVKIERGDKGWRAGDYSWSEEELVSLIESNSERFSPNVFLRPVIQDKLLPTLGYVAGPGEVAYYGQMKDFYQVFDLEMPIIFPRLSATLLESSISRVMEKLPFELYQYGHRIEDLETEYVGLTETRDIESIFIDWKDKLKAISKEPVGIITEVDGSLQGMAGKTLSGFENELDKLKGRVYKSIKQQEQTQLQRIRRAKAQLYPDSGLQERQVSFMYFMNKYGIDIWDQLFELFDKEELNLAEHYIISL